MISDVQFNLEKGVTKDQTVNHLVMAVLYLTLPVSTAVKCWLFLKPWLLGGSQIMILIFGVPHARAYCA